MESLFHFVFELVKIAILASVYSILIVLLFRTLGKNKPNSWFNKVSKKKTRLWFLIGLIISIILSALMFSYWGDHGLGDNARIPVGHGKSVEQINGSTTYITAEGYEMETLDINEFAITDDYLFAKISSNRSAAINKEIAIWNLKTNAVEFLNHFSEIEGFKSKHNIKEQLAFQNFQSQYSKYWNGWRFWLLP